MYEPQKKPIKEFMKKILDTARKTEEEFHGNLGRATREGAEAAGKKLPKSLQPMDDSYTADEWNQAFDAFKGNGLGKIGSNPEKINKFESSKGYGKPFSQGGKMGKYEFFSQFNDGSVPPNLVMKKAPPSQSDIAAGRAITIGGLGGASAAKAHSYWSEQKNKNNEGKK